MTILLLSGGTHRQNALNKPISDLALCAKTAFAPQHRRTQGTLGHIVRWLYAVHPREGHDFIDLLSRQQRAICSAVSRVAAALPSRGDRFRPRRWL